MTGYRKRYTIGCTVVDVIPYENNVTSRRDRKICGTDAVQVLYDNNLSRCDRKIVVVSQENPNRSNVIVPISRPTAPTGEGKKITKKILGGGGNEGTVDSRKCQ